MAQIFGPFFLKYSLETTLPTDLHLNRCYDSLRIKWFINNQKNKKMKRQVEVFTANCPVCDPVVKMIEELACDKCEVTTYDLVKKCDDKTCLTKLNEYEIRKIPAVAVNGKLLDCCKDSTITKEKLMEAGIGQS